MPLFTIFIACLFSIVSTAIMSYIAMATPIGPWIESILALSGILIVLLLKNSIRIPAGTVAYATAAGGIGGILATACGFSFPTLFFLDKSLFNAYMAQPWSFVLLMAGLSLSAGFFGYLIATIYEETLLKQKELPFPIGEITAKMVDVQQSIKQAFLLGTGFASALFYHLFLTITQLIPDRLRLLSPSVITVFKVPSLTFATHLVPLLFAIGFIAGHILAVPLGVGVITQLLLINPMHQLFFQQLSIENVILAFCSGLMVQGALQSILDIPRVVITAYKRLTTSSDQEESWIYYMKVVLKSGEFLIGAAIILSFLWWCNFSALEQCYLLGFTFICTYQLMIIGGKIGMAPLGRFATIVVLPSLLLFGIDPFKVTIIATFVELSGGVAVDVLFGRKMAQVLHLDRKKIAYYQVLGLVLSAVTVGIVFWFLINRFGLGTAELFAQKARARALLLDAFHFDYTILVIGICFGFILKYLNINSLLVLGGLSMPLDYSVLLILGGLSTYATKQKEEWYPLWSGVFAASSLWMLCKAFGF